MPWGRGTHGGGAWRRPHIRKGCKEAHTVRMGKGNMGETTQQGETIWWQGEHVTREPTNLCGQGGAMAHADAAPSR